MIEGIIDKSIILDTLKRVRHSLNCRFEKDASLFIDNQQAQELKSMIYSNQWQGIHDGLFKLGKLSSEILTIEIIKNAWLLKKINRRDKDYIISIFNACDKSIFIERAQNIIDNNIYASRDIKNIINSVYYMNIDLEICKNILNSNDNKIYDREILKVCVYRVLNECENPTKLRYAIKELLEKVEILEEGNILVGYIKNLDKDGSWLKKLAQEIFDNEIEYKEHDYKSIWAKMFRALKVHSYEVCSEYLNKVGSVDTDSSIKITKFYMADQFGNDPDNEDYYFNLWIDLFKNNECIRKALVLGLQRVFDKNLKKKFITEMKTIEDSNQYILNLLKKAEDEIEVEVEQINADETLKWLLEELCYLNNKKNIVGHRNYLINKTINNKFKKEILEGLTLSLDEEEVQVFFLETINQFKSRDSKTMKNVFVYLTNYIQTNKDSYVYEQLKDIIKADVESFRFEESKKFLTEYEFDFYKELFGNK